MALLAGGLTSIVLYASLGGTTYPWWSGPMVVLLVLSVVLSVGFVVAERLRAEPLVPLSLFRNRVFSVVERRSGSSSAWRCSARSPTSRSTSRW